MLCQICNKNKATVHYKVNMNGNISETNLCSACAEKHGFGAKQLFVNIGQEASEVGQDGLFGGLFAAMSDDNADKSRKRNVCPECGMRFSDFLQDGRIGCAECYKTFSSDLYPAIKRIHGRGGHCGKVPKGKSDEIEKKRKIEELRAKLNKSVEEQEYELAAKYRDEIRALENSDSARDDGEGKK